MTTLGREHQICFVCGSKHEYTYINSTNEFGSPDLDLRPPQMKRSTMRYWVQRCPNCGYCAPDISTGPDIAKQIVQSPEYIAQRDHQIVASPDLQDSVTLANSFLCRALIAAAAGEFSNAGWATLHAAWTCDDMIQPDSADDGQIDLAAAEAAVDCRKRAITYFLQAREHGKSFTGEAGGEELILADLYRRTGQFAQVERICEDGLPRASSETIQRLFHVQSTLASRQDTRCYTIADALNKDTELG